MFYEDVRVQARETVSGLGVAYGYKAADWRMIWDDPKNSGVVDRRGVPAHLQVGDILQVPIPWRMISRVLAAEPHGAGLVVDRDGGRGTRLNWAQTVYQSNQPVGTTTTFCVDACPANDNQPFYDPDTDWAAHPEWLTHFEDHPSRGAPTAAQGTTRWRAIVSIAVVTGKRVTVYDSTTWGWNMTPAGVVTTVGPRDATRDEIDGHLRLLRIGRGTGPLTFGGSGWTFRRPPVEVGDFPMPDPNVRYA